ncbi:hypothetical protein HY768_04965 [candidate division TA06 bacterium]|uniref:Uncharacterized protein n=1 Tax=candidate division TA06 bacterium TaxID=2250710 RepID=A0A933MKM3_UNCT6|nr:hypothetical protein [candidate division TA06 bacterium]
MDKVDFVLYQGVRILLLDVSHSQSAEENISAFQEAQALIVPQPPSRCGF